MPSALIGAGPLRGKPGRFRDLLHAAGFHTVDPPGDGMLTSSELARWLPGCSAIVAGGEDLGPAMFDLEPSLRVIARTGVGYDSVDVPAASARRIAVAITPGTNHDSVAEQAFALLLAVSRRIALNDRMARLGGWDRTLVSPIRGRTLGLIGFGRIGRAMVDRARAFGMHVVASDPLYAPNEDDGLGVPMLRLDELLRRADVVSLHCPALPATRHIIGREALALMPSGSILINTARGSVVDEMALLDALRQGHLAGAGLDVLDQEPPPADHPLLQLDQVVISPHLGGIDTLAMAAMAEAAAQNVIDLYQGRWPSGSVVNNEIREGWNW